MDHEPRKLQIKDAYKTLAYGEFTYSFSNPRLLMHAITVPIAYLPMDMQGISPTLPDGKKLAFLGDSVLRTVSAMDFCDQKEQDMPFWTTHFDNGIGKDTFLARMGEMIGVARYLVVPDGTKQTSEFWETTQTSNGANKAIPSAMEALIGAMWQDSQKSEPKKNGVEWIQKWLKELGMEWPKNVKDAQDLRDMIRTVDERTREKAA